MRHEQKLGRRLWEPTAGAQSASASPQNVPKASAPPKASSTAKSSMRQGQLSPAEHRPQKGSRGETSARPAQRDSPGDTGCTPTRVEGIFLEIVDHLVAMSSLGTSVDLPAFQREGHLFCSLTRLAKTRNNVHAAVQSERTLLFAAGGDAKRMSKAPELERGGGGPPELSRRSAPQVL